LARHYLVHVVDFLYGLTVIVDGDVFLILFQELDADLVGFLSRYTIPEGCPRRFVIEAAFQRSRPIGEFISTCGTTPWMSARWLYGQGMCCRFVVYLIRS